MKKIDFNKPFDIQILNNFSSTIVSGRLMPEYSEIPKQFKYGGDSISDKWIKFQTDWFFKGIKSYNIKTKDGIDIKASMKQLQLINSSLEPRHEHKKAGFAYLCSLWFEDGTWEVFEKIDK